MELRSRAARQSYQQAAEALRNGDLASAVDFLVTADRREQQYRAHQWVGGQR